MYTQTLIQAEIPTRKDRLQPSDRVAPLGIMGFQLRVPLNPLENYGTMVPRGLKGALNWADEFLSFLASYYWKLLEKVYG